MRAWVLVLTLGLGACGAPQALPPAEPPQAPPVQAPTSQAPAVEPPPTEWRITSIDWDDADSGDINGVRFRLYSIDAPETGSVRARIGAAKCEAERALGRDALAWMQELTEDPATLRITRTYGYDRMEEPRLLIDLSAGGADVGQAGIAAGHLAPWPHDGSRRLAPKPDWCR
jgi:endonuclease YncB( thermonuclease family)